MSSEASRVGQALPPECDGRLDIFVGSPPPPPTAPQENGGCNIFLWLHEGCPQFSIGPLQKGSCKKWNPENLRNASFGVAKDRKPKVASSTKCVFALFPQAAGSCGVFAKAPGSGSEGSSGFRGPGVPPRAGPTVLGAKFASPWCPDLGVRFTHGPFFAAGTGGSEEWAGAGEGVGEGVGGVGGSGGRASFLFFWPA